MLRQIKLLTVCVVGLVALSATRAEAQSFSGWGWFGFSSIVGLISLKSVPNPSTVPTVVIAQGSTGTIEYFCAPGGNAENTSNSTPGASGAATFNVADLITPGEISKTKGTGQTTLTIPLAPFVTSAGCTSNQMAPIVESAGVKDFSVVMQIFRCTGDPAGPDGACFENEELTIESAPRDTVRLDCVLDTNGDPDDNPDDIIRDPVTLHTVTGANTFTCEETVL
jgi:hypothetical protein